MHYNMYQGGGWNGMELLGLETFPLFGLLPLLVWLFVWKGWALWLAARRGETFWFVALLLVNTLGILEIIYIFAVAKRQDAKLVPSSEDDKEAAQSDEAKAD